MYSLSAISANAVVKSVINSENILEDLMKTELSNDAIRQIIMSGLTKTKQKIWYRVHKTNNPRKKPQILLAFNSDPSCSIPLLKSILIRADLSISRWMKWISETSSVKPCCHAQ